MIGPDGQTEIPYQWISGTSCWDKTATKGCILVQDGLPANATRTYTLQGGVEPTATVTNPVTITSGTCLGGIPGWIIANGLTGVCVPKTQSAPYRYAPIQGIQLADGTWTGAISGTPNLIYNDPTTVSAGVTLEQNNNVYAAPNSMRTPASIFTGEITSFIDAGPLKTTVQLAYTANKPVYAGDTTSTTAGTPTSLTFLGLDTNTPAVMFFNNGTPPPSPLTYGIIYYLDNCTSANSSGTNPTCNLSTTPGGPVIQLGAYRGNASVWRILSAAGAGHYTVQMTLYANRPAFLFDFDRDLHIQWLAPMYNEVQPDTRRYRGAGSNSAICGYEAPLPITNITNTSPPTVTTSGALNADIGNQIIVSGVNGATGANGTFYMCAVNRTTGTFTLHTTSGCNTPASAPGTYISGGAGKPQYTTWSDGTGGRNFGRDAFYDLDYSQNWVPTNACAPSSHGISQLGVDYPPSWVNSGWYDFVYNSTGSSSSPVVGLFQGRFSKLVNVAGLEQGEPGWFASNNHWLFGGPNAFGLEEINTLDESSPVAHGSFGVFVGTVGQLANPNLQQPIGVEMNTFTGINLSSLYTYKLTYNDPPGGFPYPYMNSTDFANWVGLFRDGTALCGSANCYYNTMVASGGVSSIYDMWHFNDAAHTAVAYNALVDSGAGGMNYFPTAGSWSGGIATLTIGPNHINVGQPITVYNINPTGYSCSNCLVLAVTGNTVSYALQSNPGAYGSSGIVTEMGFPGFVNVLASGDNKWAPNTHYYQLFLNQFAAAYPQCSAIILDANVTPAQKNGCKALLAFGGSLTWDNDYFPWDNISGDGQGVQNQQVQFDQYRSMASSQLSFQPNLSSKVALGGQYIAQSLASMANQYGSGPASLHYQGTYTSTIYHNFENAAVSSSVLSFPNYPIWKQHVQWLLSGLTPPEPRFGTARKCLSNGDGNTEAACQGLNGMIAEGLSATDPVTAGNAMWGWNSTNTSSQYTIQADATLAWAINPLVPAVTPNLSSGNFPGYWSVARYGFGTPYETSVHFINGDFYQSGGHRHADHGQVSIYAHSAPLAIDWNANLYNPPTGARGCHNSIVLDSELPGSWGADAWVCDSTATGAAATAALISNNTSFNAFSSSTQSIATFTFPNGTVWTRSVRTIAANLAYPLIYVKDSFSGTSAAAPKTLTWNLMATGSVLTPAGVISPIVRFSGPPNAATGCNTVPVQYPSNGTINSLADGLQQFTFTGATWKAHATGGINWDLWEIPSSDGSAQFLIGNWGHGCNEIREMVEFQAANGAPFNERQHILRVHDTGTFQTLIAPYRNGETPTRTVTIQPCGIQTIQASEVTCFNDSALTYTNGTKTILAVYDSSSQVGWGFTASGGAQELVNDGMGTITWTIEDTTPGIRSITLPVGTWYPSLPVQYNPATGAYTYYHAGGAQPSPVTITFVQTPVTLRAINLNYQAPAGATQVRLKFGTSGNYAAIAPCSPVCSVTMQAPVGNWPEQHDFLDATGAVVSSSSVRNMPVQ
jgi:hypothetical protein